MKTNELSQKEQLETNGGSMPYHPDSYDQASAEPGTEVQPLGTDQPSPTPYDSEQDQPIRFA